jgi:hypothetical protein
LWAEKDIEEFDTSSSKKTCDWPGSFGMRCRCMRPCYRKELFFHVEFLAQESSAKAPVVDVLVGIDEKNYFFIVCTAGSNKM